MCQKEPEKEPISDGALSHQKALEFLWDEYKMRQTHYWSSFNRYGVAVIAILVVPYVKPDVGESLGPLVAIFPVVALLLSVAATWLLGAEYQRLRSAKERFEEHFPEAYRPEHPRRGFWTWVFGLRIGAATVLMFGLGLMALSIAGLLLLGRLPVSPEPTKALSVLFTLY